MTQRAEVATLVARALHSLEGEGQPQVSWGEAWRAVRRLTAVCRAWREGVDAHLCEHVRHLIECAVWPPTRPLFPRARSAHLALLTAGTLLLRDKSEPVARLLLGYVPNHTGAAKLLKLCTSPP